MLQIFWILRDEHARPVKVFRRPFRGTAADDVLVYEEKDPQFYIGIHRLSSEKFMAITTSDHETSEVYLLSAAAITDAPQLMQPRTTYTSPLLPSLLSSLPSPLTSGVLVSLDHSGSQFYILTNADGATNFQIFCTPQEHISKQHWHLLVPHDPNVYIEAINVTSAYLVQFEKVDALNRITVHDLQSHASFCIDFSEEVYCLYPASLSSYFYFSSNWLRFSYQSPTTPTSIYDYTIPTKERVCVKVQEIPSGHNPADYRVFRLNAPAPDGQLVPIFVLHHSSTTPNSSTPLYVYGYGSYGCSSDPTFSVADLSLVDRGWITAVACVRGGSDKGREWFLNGRLFSKKNSFTDFIAATEHLHSRNFGSKATTITHGASAGGLLVAGVATMRPDLQAACVMQVPFVDVLNTMSDDSLPLTPMVMCDVCRMAFVV